MKVSGFTFVRNAIKYDYPVVQAISSILPLCDEVVVAVGNSDDETLALIKSIPSAKIKIIETVWNDTLRAGGRVLALETDKAFKAISADADWAIYIQGDEIMHEKDYDVIQKSMLTYQNNPAIEGLLFNYKHFYGSYDYVGKSYAWYRREIRIVKNIKTIFSYADAQGFRKAPNEKLNVKHIDASIYHYGWVRDPRAMQGKLLSMSKYYNTDQWIDTHIIKAEEFDYTNIDVLSRFTETHPKVMQDRINALNWTFSYDLSRNNYKLKDRIKKFIEQLTGWLPGEYRNYKIVK